MIVKRKRKGEMGWVESHGGTNRKEINAVERACWA